MRFAGVRLKCVALIETDSENEIKTYGEGLARRRKDRRDGLEEFIAP